MRSVLLALSLVACASEPAPTPGQQFLGTWSFATGTNNVVCPTGTTAEELSGSLTIKTATAGGLVVLDAQGCNFTYDLDGDQATLGSKKSCSFAVPQLGAGTTAEVTYDNITLSTRDGKTMQDVFSGKVKYVATTGSLDCAFSGTGGLAKVSDQ